MKWFKRICVLLLLAAAFFWGMLFTSENTAQVALNLVFWQLNPASMSLWVILSFAVGGLTGVGFSVFLVTKLKTRLHRAERRVQIFEKEVVALRANAIKNS